jgi:hypothetical protein
MHREMMLTAAYALSSESSDEDAAADPENRYFWRANRRRLEVEALRDTMLFVTGKLELTAGGPAFSWDKPAARRTVYGKVSRFRMERMLALFDFPDPNITSEQRINTNVPPQKLFFLNSDFAVEQAKALAARLQEDAVEDAARIERAYQLLFGRSPTAYESRRALDFLNGGDKALVWPQYAQMLLSSNEFSFVD